MVNFFIGISRLIRALKITIADRFFSEQFFDNSFGIEEVDNLFTLIEIQSRFTNVSLHNK